MRVGQKSQDPELTVPGTFAETKGYPKERLCSRHAERHLLY